MCTKALHYEKATFLLTCAHVLCDASASRTTVWLVTTGQPWQPALLLSCSIMRDYRILLNELARLLGKPFSTSVWRIKGMVWGKRETVSEVLCFFFLSFIFFLIFLLPTCSIPAPSSSIIPEAVKWHLVKVAVLLSHLGRFVKARLVKVTVPVGTVNKDNDGQNLKYIHLNKLFS